MKNLVAPQNENTNAKSIEDVKNTMKIQGSHRTLFYRQWVFYVSFLYSLTNPLSESGFRPSRKHASCTTVLFYMETDKRSPKKVTFGSKPEPKITEEISKKEMVITLPVKSSKMVAKGIQTDFRESEAQTLPWKHEIRAEKKVLDDFAVLDSVYSTEGSFICV